MKEVIGLIIAGIPIDMVGGTSMGSFVGATYAEYGDVTKMCQKVRDWSLVSTIFLFVFFVGSEKRDCYSGLCRIFESEGIKICTNVSALFPRLIKRALRPT